MSALLKLLFALVMGILTLLGWLLLVVVLTMYYTARGAWLVLAITVHTFRLNPATPLPASALPAPGSPSPEHDPTDDGAPEGGAPEGGAPEGGAPEGGDARPDPAYRGYLFGPAFQDLAGVLADVGRLSARWLLGAPAVPDRYGVPVRSDARPRSAVPDRHRQREPGHGPTVFHPPEGSWLANVAGLGGEDGLLIPMPYLLLHLAQAVGLTLGAAAAALTVLAAAALTATVLAMAAVLGGGLASALRGLESCSLWARGATPECVACHRRVRRPVYECSTGTCGARHRRLEPGRHGVLVRRCRCGTRLPTLRVLGKPTLRARCDACDALLPTAHEPTAHEPTAHEPVVAGPAAGRTAFLLAAPHGLDVARARLLMAWLGLGCLALVLVVGVLAVLQLVGVLH